MQEKIYYYNKNNQNKRRLLFFYTNVFVLILFVINVLGAYFVIESNHLRAFFFLSPTIFANIYYIRKRNMVPQKVTLNIETNTLILTTINNRIYKDNLKNIKYVKGNYAKGFEQIHVLYVEKKSLITLI